MIIILAIDALEHEIVEKFNLENLKQKYYGKTDISEFSEPRTIVLWSSFVTGKNKEKEILAKGKKEMWNLKIDVKDTFFSKFKKAIIFDLPGFNYDEVHGQGRKLLKEFFETEDEEIGQEIVKRYNALAFKHHKKIKKDFLKALNQDYDLVLGYFSLADVIGHLSFGDRELMGEIYHELDSIANVCREKRVPLIILSDHGMKQLGKFGDHSEYGFWSTNFKNLGKFKITDFHNLILNLKKGDS